MRIPAAHALFLVVMLPALGGCAAHRIETTSPSAGGSSDTARGETRRLPDSPGEHPLDISTLQPRRTAPAASNEVDRNDASLRSALEALRADPSAERHHLVALRYLQLGISDKAFDHDAKALRLDPKYVPALESTARIWRDWGFPHLGLGNATRAAYFAPDSASAQNTLGTILQALNLGADARMRFTKAAALDQAGVYASNNLCYSWFLEGESSQAIAACREAVRRAPHSTVALNNLALAYASRGDLAAAERAFEVEGGRAAAQFNMGMIYMARREFGAAAASFGSAAQLEPSLAAAQRRLRQASELAAHSTITGGAGVAQ